VVEDVEELGSELDSLPFCDVGFLEHGEIEVQLVRTTHDPDPGVAETGSARRTRCQRRRAAVRIDRGRRAERRDVEEAGHVRIARFPQPVLGPLTLFFQHGWGNAADFWDHIFNEHLDLTGLRCIAASYRGHGGSGKAISGYTHDRFASDMFAVADASRADRFVLVGFSMADKFCRYMADLQPSRVWGQVLIAPPGPEPLGVPREAFAPWLEAAPDPQ
jgi:pimeloyl-ACP methyl ester carboxylesterase